MKMISRLCQMAISKHMAGHTQKSSTDFQIRYGEGGKGLKFSYYSIHFYTDMLINLVYMWYLCSVFFLLYWKWHFCYQWFIPYYLTPYLQRVWYSISVIFLPFPCTLVFPFHPIYFGQNNFQKSQFHTLIVLFKYLPLKNILLPMYL